MNGNHKLNNVQQLYDSASKLYSDVVVGGETSADFILSKLNQGITNLKNGWKGADAGVNIQDAIIVHNAMVSIRNVLAQLAVDSSKVAVNYRNIQNANGAGLENLSTISFEDKTNLEMHSDNADTIDMQLILCTAGKNCIEAARNTMDAFKTAVVSKYDEIMNNWTAGPGRDKAQSAFEAFNSNVERYKQILANVTYNLEKAIANYNQ